MPCPLPVTGRCEELPLPEPVSVLASQLSLRRPSCSHDDLNNFWRLLLSLHPLISHSWVSGPPGSPALKFLFPKWRLSLPPCLNSSLFLWISTCFCPGGTTAGSTIPNYPSFVIQQWEPKQQASRTSLPGSAFPVELTTHPF